MSTLRRLTNDAVGNGGIRRLKTDGSTGRAGIDPGRLPAPSRGSSGQNAHVNRNLFRAAGWPNLFSRKNTQQFRLKIDGQFAYFVQKDCSSLGDIASSPSLDCVAPVNAAFTYPNRSLSISVGTREPQSMSGGRTYLSWRAIFWNTFRASQGDAIARQYNDPSAGLLSLRSAFVSSSVADLVDSAAVVAVPQLFCCGIGEQLHPATIVDPCPGRLQLGFARTKFARRRVVRRDLLSFSSH